MGSVGNAPPSALSPPAGQPSGSAFSKSWGNRFWCGSTTRTCRGDFPRTALSPGPGSAARRSPSGRAGGLDIQTPPRGHSPSRPPAGGWGRVLLFPGECPLGAPGGRVWEGARPSHKQTRSRIGTRRRLRHLTGATPAPYPSCGGSSDSRPSASQDPDQLHADDPLPLDKKVEGPALRGVALSVILAGAVEAADGFFERAGEGGVADGLEGGERSLAVALGVCHQRAVVADRRHVEE